MAGVIAWEGVILCLVYEYDGWLVVRYNCVITD